MAEFIKKDPCVTVDDISVSEELSYGTANRIIKDRLKFCKVYMQLVLHHLTSEQEGCHMIISLQALQHYNDFGDEFLSTITTNDEIWRHYFQPELK